MIQESCAITKMTAQWTLYKQAWKKLAWTYFFSPKILKTIL